MNNCNKNIFPYPTYRIVQTIYERDTIPCEERINGMTVVVIEKGTKADNEGTIPEAYTSYMLKGEDPCVNTNWKRNTIDLEAIKRSIGHITNDEIVDEITQDTLNLLYPKVSEGFKVTFTQINSTFTKISNQRWTSQNSFIDGQ